MLSSIFKTHILQRFSETNFNSLFFLSVFSCIWTEYGAEKTPFLETFHVVIALVSILDTYIFSQFTSIHHNCSQVYVLSLSTSLFITEYWNKYII